MPGPADGLQAAAAGHGTLTGPAGGYVVVQPAWGQSFDIERFGRMRVVALVGGVLALLGLVLPWLSLGFIGINVFQLLQLAAMVGSLGASPLMLYSGLIAGVTAGVGVLVLLVRNSPEAAKGAAAAGLLTFLFAILFIVGVGTTGGTGAGLQYLGAGVFVSAAGGMTMFVGAASHARRSRLGAYPPPGAWMEGMPQAYPSPPYAGEHEASPSGAPDASPCPRCAGPVFDGHPTCPACGLGLAWV